MRISSFLAVVLLAFYSLANLSGQSQVAGNNDPRYIENGVELPSEHYVDQPYVIVCDDGSWVCVMTTSGGGEGAHMNHIVSTKSYDQGKTWTRLTDVEASGVPQSSWAVPIKVPGGRIYAFYNYNGHGHEGITGVMSGPFAYKYSDDHGKTWSHDRFEIPVRVTQIDRDNFTKGKSQFFWSIDKPVVTDEAAYITYSKLLFDRPGGANNYIRGEGFILKSENILTESDPNDIKWELLPEGEVGIYNPDFGIVQAEHNMTMLNNGDLYVVLRTTLGHPAYAISRDGGKTFSTPKPMRYANGNLMGNTRACPKIHKTKDGKYLFWFHNNFRSNTFDGRNPAWLSGGIEKDGEIAWSQPEIVIYDVDPRTHSISYPDFIEQDGKFWITETQKSIARIHSVDVDLLNGLWSQFDQKKVIQKGKVFDADKAMLDLGEINFPQLPGFRDNQGFSLEFWIDNSAYEPGIIFSTKGLQKKGIDIKANEDGSLTFHIHDGMRRDGEVRGGQSFTSDKGILKKGELQHVVFTIDGAAKIVTIMVDGVMSDGALNERPYGWGRLYTFMTDLNDTYKGKVGSEYLGKIQKMRVYNRYLTTSEAVSNFNAGL